MQEKRRRIAIVGGGPRAVATFGRIVADASIVGPTEVDIFDSVAVGSGRTWRDDQNHELLNNTFCAETTVFADSTITVAGEPLYGPSLADWVGDVAGGTIADQPQWLIEEAKSLGPWGFPSRALQGHYIRWALDYFAHEGARRGVKFAEHRTTVIDINKRDGRPQLVTADGRVETYDHVVLTQGLLPEHATTDELAPSHGSPSHDDTRDALKYFPRGFVAETDFDVIAPQENVLVRGLGANFFDLIGIFFTGRGGRFAERSDGSLHYEPSGREPHLIAGSRHGLPYRAKARPRAGGPVWPALPRFNENFEADAIRAYGGQYALSFSRDLWPLIEADLHELFDSVADTSIPGAFPHSFDWHAIVYPADRHRFATTLAWNSFLDTYFADEAHGISDPHHNPRKYVHQAIEVARRRLARLVIANALDRKSVLQELSSQFLSKALVTSSGPPHFRALQVKALREQGFIELAPPQFHIERGEHSFTATSVVPGWSASANTAIDARVAMGNLHNVDDPLITNLLGHGLARFHRLLDHGEIIMETNTLDVTPDRFFLIHEDDAVDSSITVLGSPAADVQWYTSIGAVPNTGDKFLVGAERAAQNALGLVQHSDHPSLSSTSQGASTS